MGGRDASVPGCTEMRTIWPKRKWVDTANGWAGREVGFADTKRRQHVENQLATEDDAQRLFHGEQIQRWADVLENLDEHVRQQPAPKTA